MTWALIGSDSAICAFGSPNSITTSGFNSSGANFIVVMATALNSTYGGGSQLKVTDNYGNSWTELNSQTASTSYFALFYTASPPTVGSGHQFTLSDNGGSPVYGGIAVLAFSGAASSSAYDGNQSTNGGSGSSFAPGAITPGQNNSLVISGFDSTGTNPDTINDSNFTIQQQQPFNSAQNYGVAIAYDIQTTAVSVNPTWTCSGGISSECGASIASFKPLTLVPGVLSITNTYDTEVDLSMTSPSGGTLSYTYQPMISTDGGSTYSNYGSPISGQSGSYSWNETGLYPNSPYYWKIAITDASSTTVYTSPVNSTTTHQLTLATPIVIGVSSTSITLKINVVTGGTSTYLNTWQYSTDDATWLNGGTVSTSDGSEGYTSAPHVVGSLSPNTTYYIRVLTTDSSTPTEAGFSSTVSYTTSPALTLPIRSPHKLVEEEPDGDGRLKSSWNFAQLPKRPGLVSIMGLCKRRFVEDDPDGDGRLGKLWNYAEFVIPAVPFFTPVMGITRRRYEDLEPDGDGRLGKLWNISDTFPSSQILLIPNIRSFFFDGDLV